MSYQKPILTEILTGLSLEENSFPESRFFDFIGKVREIGFPIVELNPLGPKNGQLQISMVGAIVPAVRCWNESKNRLIQFSKDHISVNLSGPYPGWQDYKALFLQCAQELAVVIGDLKAKSITMGTIDSMTVPSANFTLGKFLNCGGNKIPAWYDDCNVAADILLGKGVLHVDGANQHINVSLRKDNEQYTIRILSNFQQACVGLNLPDVLNELHGLSLDCFESLITDFTRREVMGGKT